MKEHKTHDDMEQGSAGVDRRSFLKMSGLAAGLAAFAAGGLAGCAPQNGSDLASTGEPPVSQVAESGIGYSVFDADVLLIGGGYGASLAMREAVSQGKRVLCVDKTPYGFGGGNGMNFDIAFGYNPQYDASQAEATVDSGAFLRSRQLNLNALQSCDFANNVDLAYANMGEVFTRRKEDGTVSYFIELEQQRAVENSFTRHYNDHFSAKEMITIHDKTMITDFLIEDGKCVGAVGVHLPTGEYRVYRAKATVAAPGGCTQFNGWHTVSCTSNNTADNTGDLEGSVLRHGGCIANTEFAAYDVMGVYPTGFAASNGSNVAGDSMHITSLLDSEGTFLVDYPGVDPTELFGNQDGVIRLIARVNEEGKGSENGGAYLSCTPEDIPTMRLMYTRNIDLLKEKFGFDVTQEVIEVVPEMYEHGGGPVVDDNCMSIDFPGLFCVRSANGAGSEGGNNTASNRLFGPYAMKKALEYVDSVEDLGALTLETAQAEFARLEDLRTRTVDDPIRPVAIRRAIQRACGPCMCPVRPQDKLEAAKAELDRIAEEDVPRMACADSSKSYNVDWKDAIETLNILDMARMSVEATLVREESRGAVIRPEFPETDDANWSCMIAFTKGEDGSLSYTKMDY